MKVVFINKKKKLFNVGDVFKLEWDSGNRVCLTPLGKTNPIECTRKVFDKDFVTIEEWREQKINKILYKKKRRFLYF